MTVDERTEVFAALAELAGRYPHWRVGQLVANVAGWANADIWDAEDEQLLSAVRTHLSLQANGIEPTVIENATGPFSVVDRP